jgi:hypothetical protein
MVGVDSSVAVAVGGIGVGVSVGGIGVGVDVGASVSVGGAVGVGGSGVFVGGIGVADGTKRPSGLQPSKVRSTSGRSQRVREERRFVGVIVLVGLPFNRNRQRDVPSYQERPFSTNGAFHISRQALRESGPRQLRHP